MGPILGLAALNSAMWRASRGILIGYQQRLPKSDLPPVRHVSRDDRNSINKETLVDLLKLTDDSPGLMNMWRHLTSL